VCTHVTEVVPVTGSAKGGDAWVRLNDAVVYFDHPVHALAEHTLNIDLPYADPARPAARIGIELTAESARALATTILGVLDAVPEGVA
jgi:hypothetical protein